MAKTILYIDATSGVSGDRLLAACLDAGLPLDWLQKSLRPLHLPKYELQFRRVGAGAGLHIHWKESFEKKARLARDVIGQLRRSILPSRIRQPALRVFARLIQAEARAHACAPAHVHFHQLSHPDTLLDVVGFSAALAYFQVDRLLSSTILIGKRHQDHGKRWRNKIGPAVQQLTLDWPCRISSRPIEFTTPTGAALVTTLATPGPNLSEPVMRVGRGVRLKNKTIGTVGLYLTRYGSSSSLNPS